MTAMDAALSARDAHIAALIDARHADRDRGAIHITDAAGNAGLALNRPGYRCLLQDDAGRLAKEQAYIDYEKSLCDAYKGDPDDDERPPRRLRFQKRDPQGRETGTKTEEDRQAAYDAYQTDLESSWRHPPSVRRDAAEQQGDERLCSDCLGSGEIDGEECTTCGNTGMVDADNEENAEDIVRDIATHTESARRSSDSRSISQMMRDHENRMTKIYDAYDQSLAQAWRRS
jgi:hypothetical protein